MQPGAPIARVQTAAAGLTAAHSLDRGLCSAPPQVVCTCPMLPQQKPWAVLACRGLPGSWHQLCGQPEVEPNMRTATRSSVLGRT